MNVTAAIKPEVLNTSRKLYAWKLAEAHFGFILCPSTQYRLTEKVILSHPFLCQIFQVKVFMIEKSSTQSSFCVAHVGLLFFQILENKEPEDDEFLNELPPDCLCQVASFLDQATIFNKLIPSNPSLVPKLRHGIRWSSLVEGSCLEARLFHVDYLHVMRCTILASSDAITRLHFIW